MINCTSKSGGQFELESGGQFAPILVVNLNWKWVVSLTGFSTVVIKLTELRNLYGTGHGKENKRKGLSERHAKLAVGAGITLSTFLLDTFEYRRTK